MDLDAKSEKFLDKTIVVEKLLPAISGAVAFAAIRTAYFQFYGRFGLTPEALGISASRIFSDLLIGPVLVGALLGILCMIVYFIQLRVRDGVPLSWRMARSSSIRIAAAALSIGMLASAVFIVLLAGSAGTKAKSGRKPFSSAGF